MSLSRPEELYRLILDHAIDAFIAIDEHNRIVEWTMQAENIFGWKKDDVLGMTLTDTIIPQRYKAAHLAGLSHFLATGKDHILGRPIELFALRKDGTEIPVELTVTAIVVGSGRPIFSASLRDISLHKKLQEEVHRHEALTKSILNSMAGAVVVADTSRRLIMVNPAAQHLLNIEQGTFSQSFLDYCLIQPDGSTPFPEGDRPMARALRGEQVNGLIGLVRQERIPEGIWVSVNATPLIDNSGALIGGVVVFHDITEQRRRETDLARQADLLKEQASLLDLTHDAILVRDSKDTVTYWNRHAEELYGYTKQEAIGQNSHALLKTRYPIPLEEIRQVMAEQHHWEGELRQQAKSGREIIVASQWVMDADDKYPLRYLETNTDITERMRLEQSFRELQENYRLIVETTPDYAIIATDPDGAIISWNRGAELMLGMAPEDATGKPISMIFTPEDRSIGQPWHELDKARTTGKAHDIRWHLRPDGTRFWANGTVTPLLNEDGSIRGFVKIMRDQTAQRLAEEKTHYLANHDALTELPNRVQFSNQLHQAIALSERTQFPVAVLLLDLDRFKQVNDTFGHHVGDLLLQKVARRILTSLRETDFVARLGGDEFVVIQIDVSQPQAAETLARKLITELGLPYDIDGNEVVIGASVGISMYPADANNPVDLLKRSDLALYKAKNGGRGNFWRYAAGLETEKNAEKYREQALRNALANGKFKLYYQPQIDLASWTISTVEALLRWQVSDLELMLPDDFLAAAENTGLIVEIGDWALRQACWQVRQWQEQGLAGLRISVNCSARQFGNPEFARMIHPILQETALAPSSLELEVSESMLAAHPEIKGQLIELRALGVRVTIDNYGTGATSLIDLMEFEVDSLKIDRAFVQHLPHRHKDSAITSAIIHLAHDLGIDVSAGGVETIEQLTYLKSRECTSAQGFIFCPPVPAEKFEEMMMSNHWSRANGFQDLSDTVV
ncbi:MAG TPA: EAL domain-containing protein, partial [Paucimonas sp.]|nr:EAL domain-containing protein [Paucimonas sp.]